MCDDLAFRIAVAAAMKGESIKFSLTKRELFAALAMQGFAANSNATANPIANTNLAVAWADALLAALAQPKQGKEGGEAC